MALKKADLLKIAQIQDLIVSIQDMEYTLYQLRQMATATVAECLTTETAPDDGTIFALKKTFSNAQQRDEKIRNIITFMQALEKNRRGKGG